MYLFRVALMPLQILLAAKPSILGVTGYSYQRLNYIHRFSGQIVINLAALHANLMILAMKKAEMLDFSGNPKHRTGLFGCFALWVYVCLSKGEKLTFRLFSVIIVLSSIGPMRRRFHACFVIVHAVGYLLLSLAI